MELNNQRKLRNELLQGNDHQKIKYEMPIKKYLPEDLFKRFFN